MGMIEEFRQFDPDAGEIVDVEEAPVIDVIGRDTEMRGAPILILDQRIEPCPGLDIAGRAIKTIEGFLDGRRKLRVVLGVFRQFRLEICRAALHMRPEGRQMREGIAQPLKIGMFVA